MPSNKAQDVFKFINMMHGDSAMCWPWKGYHTGKGRPCFDLKGKKVTPYRLVYELVNGVELQPSIVVRHKCDNGEQRLVDGEMIGACCNPLHLELGSHDDNMDDMKRRERHGLPHHAVRAIRKLRAQGKTQAECATLYGVDVSTISRIDRGQAYSHVQDD